MCFKKEQNLQVCSRKSKTLMVIRNEEIFFIQIKIKLVYFIFCS